MADSYLKTLSSGVLLSTTVYAPAQTGLSNFLINDVIPCAEDNHYATVYVDLSDPRVPVTAAMLVSLERLLMGTSIFRSGFNFVRNFFQSREASACQKDKYRLPERLIDTRYFEQNKAEHLALIDAHFKRIFEYKSVLVIIDHAHLLNHDELGQEFCRYFRELITSNSHIIKPLYASSDMNRWRGVFENRQSPLYSEGAFVHKLPLLDQVFVRDALKQLGLKMRLEEVLYYYELLGCKPGVFMAMLGGWNPEGGQTLFAYIENQLGEVAVQQALPNLPKRRLVSTL